MGELALPPSSLGAVPAARARASSGWSCSTSTRRSRCSSARSGSGRSRPGSRSRSATGQLRRRRSTRYCRPVRPLDRLRRGGDDHRFLIAFPLAYTIAFRGGRYKNLLLFLVIAPFFTSFLLRTQSAGRSSSATTGSSSARSRTSASSPRTSGSWPRPAAVVAGITYNFLPFMTLPIYVSLEKIDRRLVEAAKDLYAGPWRPGGTIAGDPGRGRPGRRAGAGSSSGRCRPASSSAGSLGGVDRDVLRVRVVPAGRSCRCRCRASSPGSLLTFIPAMGDFVNAELLGNAARRR